MQCWDNQAPPMPSGFFHLILNCIWDHQTAQFERTGINVESYSVGSGCWWTAPEIQGNKRVSEMQWLEITRTHYLWFKGKKKKHLRWLVILQDMLWHDFQCCSFAGKLFGSMTDFPHFILLLWALCEFSSQSGSFVAAAAGPGLKMEEEEDVIETWRCGEAGWVWEADTFF